MSVISCQSCDMQYNGEGMQAGVQFKCTGCGAMVQVPAAAAPMRAAPRGRAPGGKAPGGRGARPGGGRPAAGGPRRGNDQQQDGPRFGAPAKKGSGGMVVGIAIGVITIIIIIVVVVVASGPSPTEVARTADADRIKQANEDMKKKNAEIKASNARKNKSYAASKAMSDGIKAAFTNEDKVALLALFDWDLFSEVVRANIKNDKEHLLSPLFCTGTWEKKDDRYTGKYLGTAARSGDGLKLRMMDYLGEHYFGTGEVTFQQKKSHDEKSKISKTIGGKLYLGYKLIFKFGGGKEKTFWVVAEEGSDMARIIYLEDKGHGKKISEKEAKNQKKIAPDLRGADTGTRDAVEPKDPDGTEIPSDTGIEDAMPDDEDPEASLPEAKPTGDSPSNPDLVNLIKDICERGKSLNTARQKRMSGKTKAEKKAAMGAFIDALIRNIESRDRNLKFRISDAMYKIWGGKGFIPENLGYSDMVYEMDMSGSQSDEMLRVQRWLAVYNSYKVD